MPFLEFGYELLALIACWPVAAGTALFALVFGFVRTWRAQRLSHGLAVVSMVASLPLIAANVSLVYRGGFDSIYQFVVSMLVILAPLIIAVLVYDSARRFLKQNRVEFWFDRRPL